MNVIDKITASQLNPNVPEFRVGDTVRVDVKIIEGKRERIQAFEGIVVKRHGSGVSETFTVRKVSYGVVVIKKGKVRRAKLTFLRGMAGQYKIKERG